MKIGKVSEVEKFVRSLPEKYSETLKAKMGDMREKNLKEEEWKVVEKDSAFVIFESTVKGSKFVMFKVETFIEGCSNNNVFNALYSSEDESAVLKRSGKSLKHFKYLLIDVKRNMKISNQVVSFGNAMVADREFLTAYLTRRDDDKKVIEFVEMSIDQKDGKMIQKFNDKNVRGMVNKYCILRETEKGVNMIQIMHTDPKGWMPSFVYNMGCKSSLKKQVLGKRKTVLEYMKMKTKKEEEK